MKLFLLRPIAPNSGPWNPWYDKCFGMVIRAAGPNRARVLAAENAMDEQSYKCPVEESPWTNETLTSCVELTPDGPEEVVMRDIHYA